MTLDSRCRLTSSGDRTTVGMVGKTTGEYQVARHAVTTKSSPLHVVSGFAQSYSTGCTAVPRSLYPCSCALSSHSLRDVAEQCSWYGRSIG